MKTIQVAIGAAAIAVLTAGCTTILPGVGEVTLYKKDGTKADVPPQITAEPAQAGPAPTPPPQQLACRPPYRLEIGDFRMEPRAVGHGHAIREFHIPFSSDRNGECKTTFKVLDDQNRVVASAWAKSLAPGKQSISLIVSANYKFDAKHRCFRVVANIASNGGQPDAERRECAVLTAAFPVPQWKL